MSNNNFILNKRGTGGQYNLTFMESPDPISGRDKYTFVDSPESDPYYLLKVTLRGNESETGSAATMQSAPVYLVEVHEDGSVKDGSVRDHNAQKVEASILAMINLAIPAIFIDLHSELSLNISKNSKLEKRIEELSTSASAAAAAAAAAAAVTDDKAPTTKAAAAAAVTDDKAPTTKTAAVAAAAAVADKAPTTKTAAVAAAAAVADKAPTMKAAAAAA